MKVFISNLFELQENISVQNDFLLLYVLNRHCVSLQRLRGLYHKLSNITESLVAKAHVLHWLSNDRGCTLVCVEMGQRRSKLCEDLSPVQTVRLLMIVSIVIFPATKIRTETSVESTGNQSFFNSQSNTTKFFGFD